MPLLNQQRENDHNTYIMIKLYERMCWTPGGDQTCNLVITNSLRGQLKGEEEKKLLQNATWPHQDISYPIFWSDMWAVKIQIRLCRLLAHPGLCCFIWHFTGSLLIFINHILTISHLMWGGYVSYNVHPAKASVLSDKFSLSSWPRGYKTFFMLNSAEHEICFDYKSKNTDKFLKHFSCSTQLSMLSWVEHKKVSTVGIFIFMTKWNFMLSWVEHEKSFITLGPEETLDPWPPTKCPVKTDQTAILIGLTSRTLLKFERVPFY